MEVFQFETVATPLTLIGNEAHAANSELAMQRLKTRVPLLLLAILIVLAAGYLMRIKLVFYFGVLVGGLWLLAFLLHFFSLRKSKTHSLVLTESAIVVKNKSGDKEIAYTDISAITFRQAFSQLTSFTIHAPNHPPLDVTHSLENSKLILDVIGQRRPELIDGDKYCLYWRTQILNNYVAGVARERIERTRDNQWRFAGFPILLSLIVVLIENLFLVSHSHGAFWIILSVAKSLLVSMVLFVLYAYGVAAVLFIFRALFMRRPVRRFLAAKGCSAPDREPVASELEEVRKHRERIRGYSIKVYYVALPCVIAYLLYLKYN